MPENALFSFATDNSVTGNKTRFPAWLHEDDRVTIERDSLGRYMLNEKGPGWTNLTLVGSAWSEDALHFHFDCWRDTEVRGQDMVMLVLQPESSGTSVKLEIDSQGRCVDAHVLAAGIDVDLKWESGANIQIVGRENGHGWSLLLSLPLDRLLLLWPESRPETGAVWRLNLARVIELEATVEYLLWRPTFTTHSDVLDPAAFGSLMFLEN